MRTIQMICPACGGEIKLDTPDGNATCPLCLIRLAEVCDPWPPVEETAQPQETENLSAEMDDSEMDDSEMDDSEMETETAEQEHVSKMTTPDRSETVAILLAVGLLMMTFLAAFIGSFRAAESSDTADDKRIVERIDVSERTPEASSAKDAEKPEVKEPQKPAESKRPAKTELTPEEKRRIEERLLYYSSPVNYFANKYDRIARYPLFKEESMERIRNESFDWLTMNGEGGRNSQYRIRKQDGKLEVYLAYVCYNQNGTYEKIKPVLRDLLWTCDSTFTEDEINEYIDDLLANTYRFDKPLRSSFGHCYMNRWEANGVTRIDFTIVLIGMPVMPEDESWYEERDAKLNRDTKTIADYLFEPVPKTTVPYSPQPDPDKYFDVFMDIYGEEFETEDDAWDAWEEGYP